MAMDLAVRSFRLCALLGVERQDSATPPRASGDDERGDGPSRRASSSPAGDGCRSASSSRAAPRRKADRVENRLVFVMTSERRFDASPRRRAGSASAPPVDRQQREESAFPPYGSTYDPDIAPLSSPSMRARSSSSAGCAVAASRAVGAVISLGLRGARLERANGTVKCRVIGAAKPRRGVLCGHQSWTPKMSRTCG